MKSVSSYRANTEALHRLWLLYERIEHCSCLSGDSSIVLSAAWGYGVPVAVLHVQHLYENNYKYPAYKREAAPTSFVHARTGSLELRPMRICMLTTTHRPVTVGYSRKSEEPCEGA